jgi:hypothetical protein
MFPNSLTRQMMKKKNNNNNGLLSNAYNQYTMGALYCS